MTRFDPTSWNDTLQEYVHHGSSLISESLFGKDASDNARFPLLRGFARRGTSFHHPSVAGGYLSAHAQPSYELELLRLLPAGQDLQHRIGLSPIASLSSMWIALEQQSAISADTAALAP